MRRTNTRPARVRAVVALTAAAISLFTAALAQAATPGQNGKIVFTSGRDGNYEIYSMNVDGSNPLNLSSNPAADMFPSYAPGGGLIAFTSFRDGGNGEIYVMNGDGSDPTRLTNSSGTDTQPTWSPNGQQIAFRSDRDGDWEIYVMGADGSGQTNVSDTAGIDDAPAWSPDGGRILFESDRDGDREIYMMNADGSGQSNLTAHPGQDREPSWSPDGQRIAFRSDREGNDEVYTMTQGGALQTRLTYDSATDSEPAWSPDASKILFRSSRDGNAEIYVMGTGGATQTRLTTIPRFDGHPDWQALVAGYPRPAGATPLRVSLVPAYKGCSGPTHVHGPPLGFASCNPPAQQSAHLTVGTPDANGSAASSVGSVRYGVHVGVPGLPEDSDVRLTFSLSDVRCRVSIVTCSEGALSDYTGEVEVTTDIRVTDRNNAPTPGGGSEAATVIDSTLAFVAPCTATGGAAGATCPLSTSANALSPGLARDGKRMLITMSQVQVHDGGADGLVATAPNAVFAVQGIFVP